LESIEKRERTGLEIAVIGMAGKFPGARDIDEFWGNLKGGIESISFFSDEELRAAGLEDELIENLSYVKARGILEDIEYFDSSFFDFSPREAEIMDPQVRICLEYTWMALENAGYNPDTYEGLIGIFTGASSNLFWEALAYFSSTSGTWERFDKSQLANKDYLSLQIAYNLNLRGPAITLYTTCSTSLVAVDMACKGLLTGQCDIALVGGVTVALPGKRGYLYQEGMVASPDGHVRSFDAAANGTNGGDGIGIVVLKPLEDAVAHGDYLYAVVLGSAVNNDGQRKVGFVAPSVEGQEEVIRAAHHLAEVDAETIGYIETHGTGTSLGDPIEVEALTRAFATDKKGFCRIGSVKTNVGHLDSAAGIAGFIKTVLVLKNRLIPPSLNFEKPNPRIDFDNSPFCVNRELYRWENPQCPLRAGVSSFGIGGTNAHVVLEEAPEVEKSCRGRPWKLILISARNNSTLDSASRNLAEYFHHHPHINLADAAYTLQVGRKEFRQRRMMVCSELHEAAEALSSLDDPSSAYAGNVHSLTLIDTNIPVVFMFSGQGSHYVNMGLTLYRQESAFRREMDLCFDLLRPVLGYELKAILYPDCCPEDPLSQKAEEKIYRQDVTQPLMFIFEYALARLMMRWGIKPRAMIGYSIGEYVAACLSGVFSLADALALVAYRGKLMQEIPGGTMLSVPLTERQLVPLLGKDLDLAVVNSSSCIIAGPHEAIDAFDEEMKKRKCMCLRLKISHAGHSRMMDGMLTQFERKVSRVQLNKPELPYISNVTGKWITVEEATNPGYWARQLRETVRFADGLQVLLEEEKAVFVELGPGRDLSTTLMQHEDKKAQHFVLDLVRNPRQKVCDVNYLLNRVGRLWLYGKEIDWDSFYSEEKRHRVPLPTYPFNRRPFRTDVSFIKDVYQRGISGFPNDPTVKRPDMADWFYLPAWKYSPLPIYQPDETSTGANWLVFIDRGEWGLRLVEQLKRVNRNVIVVRDGEQFEKLDPHQYVINVRREPDYHTLFEDLHLSNSMPHHLVHLLSLMDGDTEGAETDCPDKFLESGFYSLIFLAKALGQRSSRDKIQIAVVSNNMQGVSGVDLWYPQKATLLGPLRIIPREYPHISCRSIDFDLHENPECSVRHLVERLMAELMLEPTEPIVTYRGNRRLVLDFDPVRLAKPSAAVPRLRSNGVYLITGGLGGIGLTLAEFLAVTLKASLILTGRSALPSREDWGKWLDSHDEADTVGFKIKKLLELERSGARVLVYDADAADRERMQAVVSEAEGLLGPINGVVHAAGVAEGSLVHQVTREGAERIFRPKINGTLVLERIFRDVDLDFLLLCSSLNALTGGPGDAGYCAANAFLDAFAHYRSARDGQRTISINWDAWQQVGGAVKVMQKLVESSGISRPVSTAVHHPLLDKHIVDDPDSEIYISHLSRRAHWILDEHRVQGRATLPGTGYLELVRAAYEKHAGNRAIEMRDVCLLTPLSVDDEEEREVRTILVKNKKRNEGDGFEFKVVSRSGPEEHGWKPHAVGNIFSLPKKEPPIKHEIGQFEAECRRGGDAGGSGHKGQRRNVTFGSRWQRNVIERKVGNNQVFTVLELPEIFSEDLESYGLHPALMDCAVGIPGVEGNYFPFSYKRVTIHGPLPRKVLSVIRQVNHEKPGGDFLNFNITLMDDQGVELVDIEEYTLLTVSENREEAMIGGKSDSLSGDVSFSEPEIGGRGLERSMGPPGGLLKNGLLPTEGVEVFKRLLGYALPQVIISVTDLESRLAPGDPSGTAHLPGGLDALHEDRPQNKRPDLSIPYAPPRNETEQLIADTWRKFLGLEKVGIHDNFFELGATSLSIVQVNGILKEKMKQDISIVTMYAYPTVNELAGFLSENGAAPGLTGENRAQLQEISRGRNRQMERKRRVGGGRNAEAK
jgi:acyl transferase domain-containing protein/acyl carrier protein